jgi:TrmH family RNA methyltransferase
MLSKSDVKYIQSLAYKKYRDEAGVFVMEGVKMIEELINASPERIKRIYATQTWVEQHPQIVKSLTELIFVEPFELDKISFLTTPNEVLALVSMNIGRKKSEFNNGITVILDQIQDPGNLGTIIRTCDWFGVSKIVCSPDTVDAFSPRVVQSSMGSILSLDIFYKDLSTFLLENSGMPIYAAELGGKSIHEISYSNPAFLIIGNESKGISKEISNLASHKVMIPRLGSAESLNAAVATAIILSYMTK